VTVTPKVQDQLRVEMIDDAHWRLVDEFRYDSKVAGARLLILPGYVTDFASVPRVPVVYWLTGNTAHAAAVVHDYLYTTGLFSKAISDQVFLEVMTLTGVPRWRAWAMYLGVKYFGQSTWNTYRHIVKGATP
jgi:hypothetical protein